MSDTRDDSLSLGDKIRNFRKRAGLSQLELEVEIEAANGSVSRIESGAVDPTKDTIFKISKALKLAPEEETYLMGVAQGAPDAESIQSAIEMVQPQLSGWTTYAYLLDNHSCVVAVSKGFKQLGRLAGVNTDNFVGKNVAELLIDPKYGIRKLIVAEKFEDSLKGVLAVMRQERDYLLNEPWWQELISRLENFPEFKNLWRKLETESVNLYDYENRRVQFNIMGKVIPMICNFITLNPDSRFTLVEYTIEK